MHRFGFFEVPPSKEPPTQRHLASEPPSSSIELKTFSRPLENKEKKETKSSSPNESSKLRPLDSEHTGYGTGLETFSRSLEGKKEVKSTPRDAEDKDDIEFSTFSSSAELPSEDYVRLEPTDLPSHGEIKEYFDRQINTTHMTIARRALCAIFLFFGSSSDTAQFYDGVKSFPGILPWLITTLYGVQDFTVSNQFTNEGFDEILRAVNGERPPDWEELPAADERKARILSLLTNAYALFSDATATAYYFTSSNLTGNTLGFILGIFTALSSLPTEGLQNYYTMRSLYTKTEKTLENAFNLFLQSPDYDVACYASKRFKENLPEVWAELSIYLKIALQNPANKDLLNVDGVKLENTLALIFLCGNQEKLCDYLINTLKFDKNTAEGISGRIIHLHKPGYQENSKAYNYSIQSMQILEKLAKLALKIFGASQDVIGSFVSVSAMFAVESPVVKFILLILSLANGINDACFSGKNSETALDIFKKALTDSSISYKDIAIFVLSLLSGSVIGYAQFNLILDMLRDPDSTLPAPLPETLPNAVAIIMALGAAFREGTVYSYYYSPIYEFLVRIIANYWHRREYKTLQQIIHPGFETKDDKDGKDNFDFEFVFDKGEEEEDGLKLYAPLQIHEDHFLPTVNEEVKAAAQETSVQTAAQALSASPTLKGDVNFDELYDEEDEEEYTEAKEEKSATKDSSSPRPSPLTNFSVLSSSPFNPTAAVSKLKSATGGLRVLSPSQ